MDKKCPVCGEPIRTGFKSCRECGWGIPPEADEVSPEVQIRLAKLKRRGRISTLALILATIALIVSCIR